MFDHLDKHMASWNADFPIIYPPKDVTELERTDIILENTRPLPALVLFAKYLALRKTPC